MSNKKEKAVLEINDQEEALSLFGRGDENLKYIGKTKKHWTARIEKGYAEEAAHIAEKKAELHKELDGMRAFSASHAAKEGGSLAGKLGEN